MAGPGSDYLFDLPPLTMPIMTAVGALCIALQAMARRGRGSVPVYLGFWLVLVVLFAMLMANFRLPTYRTLAARGARTEGVVIALPAQEPITVRYRYELRGSRYERQHAPRAPNPPRESLRVGQKVVVVYDPASPGTSALGDPKAMLADGIRDAIAVAVGMPTLVVLGSYWEQRRARRRSGQAPRQ